MKEKKWILLIFILGLLIIGNIFFIALSRSEDETKKSSYTLYEVEKSPILLFQGKVVPKHEDVYFFDASFGRIEKIEVEENQKVQKGDIIFTYINEEQQNNITKESVNIEQIKRELSYAQQDYQKLLEKLVHTQNSLDTEEMEIEKLNQAVNEKERHEVIEEQERIEGLKLSIQQKEQEIINLNDGIVSINRRIETIEANLAASENEYQIHINKTSQNVIARNSGIVHTVTEGESNQPILHVISEEMQIIGEVSEFDYEKLSVHQKVTIQSMNSDEKILGEIVFIQKTPTEDANEKGISTYQFVVQINEKMQYGFNVQIELQKEGFIISDEAILEENEKFYVFVYEDGRIKKQEIFLEKKDEEIRVKSGVKQGDKLLMPVNIELEDGQEVTV